MSGFMLGVLVALATGLLVAEATGWLSVACRSAIRIAARRLPSTHRGRYVEEWLGELQEFEGESHRPISILLFTVRICLRVGRVRTELEAPGEALSRKAGVLKRTVDLAMASCLLVVVAPVLAAVALAIRLESRGPVLVRQRRIGKNGQPFEMFEFRTTVAVDEERSQLSLFESLPQRIFRFLRRPQLTKVGRFLRRYSLDELPRLLNVLRGEMSLVGPPPRLPVEGPLEKDSPSRTSIPGIGPWREVGDPPED